MAIDDARAALRNEKRSLQVTIERAQEELARVESALAALGQTRKAKRRSSWAKDQVTCTQCGYVSKAPQGLAAHVRGSHRPKAAAKSA